MKSIKRFFPFLEWLPTYRRSQLSGDVYAGVTVGVMLIPQGMAYALIAGLPPVYGLYAAIVPQIIYAILGTSRQLSVGSVAMDSLLVASGIAVFAEEGTDAYLGFAILLAFFVGLFQLLLGFFRMGFITNLLSKPVISGFTSAAALIIALNQLKYLLGIEIEKSSTIYTLLWEAILHVNETHVVTLAIGTSGILIIRLAKSIHKNIPGALLVVMLGTLLVYLLKLDTHGVSIVRTVPEGLPAFKRPAFDLGMFHEVLPLAFTIAIVSFIEAFSIAKSIEVKKKTHRVRPNQELIALGAANLIGSFFQSYPVTGGFSRSAVNDQIGSHTPLSSMISALLVALTLAFLTPLFYFLPHAVLASVVMVSVAGLLDWNYAKQLWHDNKVEFFLLLVTFLVTISINMVSGITTGILFSILILLYRAGIHMETLSCRMKDIDKV
ncbi:MAG: sulfate permease [Bacteroidota bacterium]